jgi:hypothetical protein
VIDPRKLIGYCLNDAHPGGGPKARLFAAVLGIRRDDWRYLGDAILADLPLQPVFRCNPARERGVATWGVRVRVKGLNGQERWVTTSWKINDGRPFLVTAYISRSD